MRVHGSGLRTGWGRTAAGRCINAYHGVQALNGLKDKGGNSRPPTGKWGKALDIIHIAE